MTDVRKRRPDRQTAEMIKKKKTGRFTKNMTVPNIIAVVTALLADAGVVYTLMNLNRFSGLSKTGFILINVFFLLFVLILHFMLIQAIRTRKKAIFTVSMVFLAAQLFVGSAGSYMLFRVNRSLNKITSTTTEESVSTSLIVYQTGLEDITDINQLDGKTVGFAENTQTAELGKNRLASEHINVSYKQYQDYSSLMLGLISGEVQCAILPSNYKAVFANESGLTQYIEKTASLLDFENKVTIVNESGSGKSLTEEPFTVLLVGNADGMSDTMILCSVNPISMRITMSSIARDSYVPIACYGGGSSKINAANAVSRDCLIKTIENLIGVHIDYYVDTNFQGVVDVVDALGGIVVDSPLSFVGQNSSSTRGHYTVWVPEGKNVVLNGEQALAFARERYAFALGDFARQVHQQEVIKAMVAKMMRTRDVNTFLKVLEAAGNNVQTNLTIEQMTGFIKYAIQKANRLYDKDHVENVFDIQNSRVTGYSSGLWDEGLQLSLYIYRLYQGSINDTRNAIERNINMNSSINQVQQVLWNTNWYIDGPVISASEYNEAHIASEVPQHVIESTQSGCETAGKHWYDNACHAEPKPTATPEATPTPTPTPTATATSEPTATPEVTPATPTPTEIPATPVPTENPTEPPVPEPTPDQGGGSPEPTPDEGGGEPVPPVTPSGEENG